MSGLSQNDLKAYQALAAVDAEKGYLFAVAWKSSALGMESGVSPYSDPVELETLTGVQIDVSGFQAMGSDSVLNVVPDAADKVCIYVCRLAWGLDQRDGNPQFHLLLETDIPDVAGPRNASRIVTYSGTRTEKEILIDRTPVYNRVAFPGFAAIGVDQNRVVGANLLPYSTGRVTTVVGSHFVTPLRAYTQLMDGSTVYSPSVLGYGYRADLTRTPVVGAWFKDREIRIEGDPGLYLIRDVQVPPGEMVQDESFAEPSLWTLGTGWTVGQTAAGENAAMFRGKTSPADAYLTIGTQEGQVVAGAQYEITLTVRSVYFLDPTDATQGLWASIGESAKPSVLIRTAGVHVLTVTAGTGLATFRLGAKGGLGVEIDVVAAIVPVAGDGLMRLYIENGDGEPFTVDSPTDGATFEIVGRPTRVGWSEVTTDGVLQECGRLLNYMDLDMPGDSLKAVAQVSGMLALVGERQTAFFVQSTGAYDDVPQTGVPYPRAQYLTGGTVAGRTVVSLPDGSAAWLTPSGTIAIATAQGVSEHPVSTRIGDWIRNWKKLDQRLLDRAYGVFVPDLGAYAIFFRPEGTPTLGEIPEQPPVDLHARWEATT
jgi:hypothetical protein